jgi:DNA-binding response OmpR family regulator
MRVLVADADGLRCRSLARLLRVELRASEPNDAVVVTAGTSADAIHQLECDTYDIVLLAWERHATSLFDGLEILCHRRRNGDIDTPMVLYSDARHSDFDNGRALDRGADDVLESPLERIKEFGAKIRAVHRRCAATRKPSTVKLGALTVDFTRGIVLVNGLDVELTGGEFRLMAYLARRACSIVSRRELYTVVLETHDRGRASNALAAAVSRLRRKLGKATAQLIAIPGVGYRLDACASQASGFRLRGVRRDTTGMLKSEG